jgi:ATP phosphoribosyltransferase regulatory subunit
MKKTARQHPRGFRDILPFEARRREEVASAVAAFFETAGYEPIETPAIEYLESRETTGLRKARDAFRFVDVDGRLLALRTDVTIPLAQIVAQRFSGLKPPYRLRYCADVFREQESLRGRERQLTQLGLECIGVDGAEGDSEILSLALGDFRRRA